MMNNDYDIDWNKVNQMDEYLFRLTKKNKLKAPWISKWITWVSLSWLSKECLFYSSQKKSTKYKNGWLINWLYGATWWNWWNEKNFAVIFTSWIIDIGIWEQL